jgi:DNA-binding protein HU-beta
MNKVDIAEQVAERVGLSRSVAGAAVEAVFEVVREALAKGEEARIAGFGVFGTRHRPARTGRNPSTGGSVEVRASTAPTFRPGKPLRDALNGGGGA